MSNVRISIVYGGPTTGKSTVVERYGTERVFDSDIWISRNCGWDAYRRSHQRRSPQSRLDAAIGFAAANWIAQGGYGERLVLTSIWSKAFVRAFGRGRAPFDFAYIRPADDMIKIATNRNPRSEAKFIAESEYWFEQWSHFLSSRVRDEEVVLLKRHEFIGDFIGIAADGKFVRTGPPTFRSRKTGMYETAIGAGPE